MKLSAAVQELMILTDLSEAAAQSELLRFLREIGCDTWATRVHRRDAFGERDGPLSITDNEVLSKDDWRLIKANWTASVLYRDETVPAGETPWCGTIVKAEGVQIDRTDFGKLAELLQLQVKLFSFKERMRQRQPAAQTRNRGGVKARINWPGAGGYVAGYLQANMRKPSTKDLASWFAQRTDGCGDVKAIRKFLTAADNHQTKTSDGRMLTIDWARLAIPVSQFINKNDPSSEALTDFLSKRIQADDSDVARFVQEALKKTPPTSKRVKPP
ncbi:MAG: hypothetical protein Q8M31_08755 [Beijerinckiaceae bacterium]|nr:hypothetical protein [Beijerinckiaceae bacterium]